MTKLSPPLIIINFKAYGEVEGSGAITLAKLCQDVADSSGVSIAVCPPMVELSSVVKCVTIPVMAQHSDNKKPGSNTGWVTPQSIKKAGAVGTLINHSEHRLPPQEIEALINSCHEIKLVSVVCADTEVSAAAYAGFEPDFIAVEPPELIGGEISVTDAKPEVVQNSVNAVKAVSGKVQVLCGAGVKTGEDVKKALELGASGVLLASGVVKAKDPKTALEGLISQI